MSDYVTEYCACCGLPVMYVPKDSPSARPRRCFACRMACLPDIYVYRTLRGQLSPYPDKRKPPCKVRERLGMAAGGSRERA